MKVTKKCIQKTQFQVVLTEREVYLLREFLGSLSVVDVMGVANKYLEWKLSEAETLEVHELTAELYNKLGEAK